MGMSKQTLKKVELWASVVMVVSVTWLIAVSSVHICPETRLFCRVLYDTGYVALALSVITPALYGILLLVLKYKRWKHGK